MGGGGWKEINRDAWEIIQKFGGARPKSSEGGRGWHKAIILLWWSLSWLLYNKAVNGADAECVMCVCVCVFVCVCVCVCICL